ncbi:MAG: hypothetical protein AMXMBFR46_29110 [Acidimicrobiia bacterium]
MTDDETSGLPGDAPAAHGGAAAGDALPEDLDVTAYVGPYQFPGTHRRRIAGTLYLIVALACAIVAATSHNDGLVAAAVLLALCGGYHLLAAWPLRVDQTEALTVASRAVGFPVGHASGQLGFRGLRSRPSWRILLYSADDPPAMRGLVELDGVDGTVLGEYTEANPEDWSAYGL